MNVPKMKIAVVGLGGAGGYFGGLLSRYAEKEKSVAIYFLARGPHLKAIQDNGLHVHHQLNAFVTHPTLATDQATSIGPVDYILLCTKSYHLSALLPQLAPLIGPTTTLIPLLNGVDHTQQLRSAYPSVTVLEGCTYLVSKITAPGCITNTGNIQKILFGHPDLDATPFKPLLTLLHEAGIDATYTTAIHKIIWEKFLFLSPLATATSLYDCTVGEVVTHHFDELTGLLKEIISLANVLQIPLDERIVDLTLDKIKSLPAHSTTSMQNDYKAGKTTEVASLVQYVLVNLDHHQLPRHHYSSAYQRLQNLTR